MQRGGITGGHKPQPFSSPSHLVIIKALRSLNEPTPAAAPGWTGSRSISAWVQQRSCWGVTVRLGVTSTPQHHPRTGADTHVWGEASPTQVLSQLQGNRLREMLIVSLATLWWFQGPHQPHIPSRGAW